MSIYKKAFRTDTPGNVFKYFIIFIKRQLTIEISVFTHIHETDSKNTQSEQIVDHTKCGLMWGLNPEY